MKEGYNMSNEKKEQTQYVFPKNVVFVMGPSFTKNSKIVNALDELYNDDDHFEFYEMDEYYTQCLELFIPPSSDSNAAEIFKMGSSLCYAYTHNFVDLCIKAQTFPDKIIIAQACPFDTFILFHTLDMLQYISKDSHYMLCNMLSDIIIPWSMSDYNVVLFYPDLYTMLKEVNDQDNPFWENLHLMYHNYFISNLAPHFKTCKIIEKSKTRDQLQEFAEYLEQLYKTNTSENFAEIVLSHPALNNECILVDKDKKLQDIQKAFDAKKKKKEKK